MKMMKKLCSVAILLAMVLTMMPVVAFAADAATADYSWYGDGSATTFTLNDVNDLIGFNNLMAGADGKTATTFEGKTVLLGKDITYNDVTDYANWATTAPANQWTAAGVVFLGTFDGQGHTITGFYMAATNHGQAMFSALGGTVRNFSLVKAYVNTAGKQRIGSVVGEGYNGTNMIVKNVSSDAIFETGGVQSQRGGIVADTNNCTGTVTIDNCTFTGSVYGSQDIAGILGYARKASSVTITNCINNGMVNGSSSSKYIGGIVGRTAVAMTINNCTNGGTISNGTAEGAGGIIGYANAATTISGCTNTNSVTSKGAYVGGIVGQSNNSSNVVSNCKNLGAVSSTFFDSKSGKDAGVGGIVGYIASGIRISNCINNANISAKDMYVGGIVGWLNAGGTIENCQNTGIITVTLSSAGNGRSGGIVGFIGISAENKTITIKGCVSGGKITAGNAAVKDLGGIVGCVTNKVITVNIDSCVVTCVINGKGTNNAYHYGAVLGYNMADYSSSTTGATGSWNADSALDGFTYAGGITISNCLIKGGNGNTFNTIVGGTQARDGDTKNNYEAPIFVNNVIFAMDVADTLNITAPAMNVNAAVQSNTIFYNNVHYDASKVTTLPGSPYMSGGDSETNGDQLTDAKYKPTSSANADLIGANGLAKMNGNNGTKWILNESYPAPVEAVQSNCVELVGYQYMTTKDNLTSYRFIAVVDELANLGVDGAMDYAGFKVSVNVGGTIKTDTVWCNNAYTSLSGDGTTYRADQYGGEYFFFFTLTNVPADTTFEITLTPFVGTSSADADLYDGVTKTLTLTTPAASGSAS